MSKITFFIVLLIFILIDLYAFQSFRVLFSSKIIRYVYWFISIVFYIIFLHFSFTFSPTNIKTFYFQFVIGFFALLYVPKLVISIPLLLEDIYRFFHFTFSKVFSSNSVSLERKKVVSMLALGIASIPFLGILYGITKGKYNFKLITQKLKFKDLPSNFNGFRILQLSDFHVGSFDNIDKVEKAIDFINSQKADLVVFTGDFVNLIAEEMLPHIDLFSKINSPNGVFSILGNHDYGTYAYGNDQEKLQKNRELLLEINKKLSYDLLLNENRKITKGNQHINIIGVENWGKAPFPQVGDLAKASEGISNEEFNVLLSHDPTHFDEKVKNFHKRIQLTLSGHTHGMQFGIEIPGFIKFSPSQFIYKKWAGLYKEKDKYLYVNRGFGYNAFPGRVGIWPEITVIELQSESQA